MKCRIIKIIILLSCVFGVYKHINEKHENNFIIISFIFYLCFLIEISFQIEGNGFFHSLKLQRKMNKTIYSSCFPI